MSCHLYFLGFSGGSVVKNLPANAGDVGSIPGLGKSPGVGNGNLPSFLAWEIPWTEAPGRLQSMGSQRGRHDLAFGEDLYFLVFYIKLSFSNFLLHRNLGIPGGKSINTKTCAFVSEVIKINHRSFLFSTKFQEEKHLENIDCYWRSLLSIHDKKNQIILGQEYVVLRSLLGNNLSVISGWKRWVAMVSYSAQIEFHLATLIFVVIFPLFMKYHKQQ